MCRVAALFEDVSSPYGKTLRLYAKRITPLSLFEMVINQLSADHRYVVIKYAMFHTWHIAELARLLKPTVGVLLNVYTEHLRDNGIRTPQDIAVSKAKLLERANHALVEREVAQRFGKDLAEAAHVFDWRGFVEPSGHQMEPFVKSRLQYVQIGAVLTTKELLLGSVTAADIKVIERFEPTPIGRASPGAAAVQRDLHGANRGGAVPRARAALLLGHHLGRGV
jgi:hypothetical protein